MRLKGCGTPLPGLTLPLWRGRQRHCCRVEFATIHSLARTHVAQEHAAQHSWGYGAAMLAYQKAQAEELPHGENIRHPTLAMMQPAEREPDAHLAGLQKAAIAALAAAALGGAILGPALLAVGAGIAAVLLLLGGHSRARPGWVPAATTVMSGPTPIGSPADETNPLYDRQPTDMRDRYRDGSVTTSERQ